MTSYIVTDNNGFVERMLRNEPQPPRLLVGEVAHQVLWLPTVPDRTVASARLYYDAGALAWIDQRTLADLKRDKAAELRDAANDNAHRNITVLGAVFKADPDTLADLAREATFAALDRDAYTLTWRRASGAWVTLTAAQTIGLARAIRDRGEAIRQQLRDKLDAVQAAASPAEVRDVAWFDL